MSSKQNGCTMRLMARSIQIRNVPDDIHRTLRARAAAAGQSLSEYLLADITRLASRPPVAEVLHRAAARAGGAPVETIAEAVRTGRDRP
jgi:antitoxin FitA